MKKKEIFAYILGGLSVPLNKINSVLVVTSTIKLCSGKKFFSHLFHLSKAVVLYACLYD